MSEYVQMAERQRKKESIRTIVLYNWCKTASFFRGDEPPEQCLPRAMTFYQESRYFKRMIDRRVMSVVRTMRQL